MKSEKSIVSFLTHLTSHRFWPFKSLLSKFLLLYIVILLFGIYFGDRGWYEEDALYQIDGIVNFAEKGPDGVYRYYWQPLAYELNILLLSIFNNINLLYILPTIFGAAGICFLVVTLHYFSNRKIGFFFSFLLLLLLPELFFTLLYYNATAFGMFFFSFALFLLHWKKRNGETQLWNKIKYMLAGVTFALACLCRFDFLLGLPMLMYLFIFKEDKWLKLSFYLLGGLIVLVFAFLTGMFNPEGILAVQKQHTALVWDNIHSYNWTLTQAFQRTFTITNILIFVALFLYLLYFLIINIREKKWKSLLVFLPGAVLLYPVSQLTSPKYLIPAIFFLPFVFVKMIEVLRWKLSEKNFQKLTYYIITVSIGLQVLSFEITTKAFPYFRISPNPTFIGTADGRRAFGAYLRGYYDVRKSNVEPNWVSRTGLGHKIVELVTSSNSNFIIIFPKKRETLNSSQNILSNLCHIPLYLQGKGYKKTHKSGKIFLKGKKNTVVIEWGDFPEKLKGNILIKMPYIPFSERNKTQKMKAFLSYLNSIHLRIRNPLPPLSGIKLLSVQTKGGISAINGKTWKYFHKQPIVVNKNDYIFIRGWAVDTKIKDIAGGVYIKIDGALYPTVYGTHREDVARGLKVPAYRDSGFEVSIPVSEIGAGQHTITVITLTKDRKSYYKPKSVKITIQEK